MSSTSVTALRSAPGVGFREFVALMAALMAVNALGVDSMLAALPDMADSLGIGQENQRQWIIASYMLGFGATQLIVGPLGDRFGRRPVLLIGLLCYVGTSLFASLATSFEIMILARTLQGMAASATRVLVVAMVRDCYSGRQMARVMSLTFIVFLAVPMIAPTAGQLILFVAPWPAIFVMLAALAGMVALWISFRLGETLRPEYRRSIDPFHLLAAARLVLVDRFSLGYTLGLTMSFGAMVGFINSAQQLLGESFGAAELFPLVFAVVAGGMAIASFINSRVVLRLGSRFVSHGAMLAYIALCALHLVSLLVVGDSLLSFTVFQFAIMLCSGLLGANFGAMAMENMGEIAGTASSIQGTISTLGGTLIGIAIGQSFNGTAFPLVTGYFLCSLGILGAVLYAERGRLFRPHHAAPVPPSQ